MRMCHVQWIRNDWEQTIWKWKCWSQRATHFQQVFNFQHWPIIFFPFPSWHKLQLKRNEFDGCIQISYAVFQASCIDHCCCCHLNRFENSTTNNSRNAFARSYPYEYICFVRDFFYTIRHHRRWDAMNRNVLSTQSCQAKENQIWNGISHCMLHIKPSPHRKLLNNIMPSERKEESFTNTISLQNAK